MKPKSTSATARIRKALSQRCCRKEADGAKEARVRSGKGEVNFAKRLRCAKLTRQVASLLTMFVAVVFAIAAVTTATAVVAVGALLSRGCCRAVTL